LADELMQYNSINDEMVDKFIHTINEIPRNIKKLSSLPNLMVLLSTILLILKKLTEKPFIEYMNIKYRL